MPRKPNQRKEYIAHYNRVERYAVLLDGIYKQAANEFAKLALSVDHDPSKAFKWSDYPQAKRRIDKLLRSVSDNIQGVVVNGVTAEWDESNFKNDRLVRSIIGIKQFDKDEKGRDKIPERFKPYFNNNTDALQSFIERKQNGLNLSQKVWKLSEQYKSDLELALSIGLSDGRSAAELSRDIRQYLKEPVKLFRRMRNEMGDLQLSKAAKAYHPGTGIYRSSYKNAMRLTRTEINMAYRTADSTRWSQLDFVVGFEVKRSGRGYDCSVCESLAGKYPKDFKFVGWHPHCRCYVIPILKTDEEFWAWDGRGEAPTSSINEVLDVPQGFNNFILDNMDRIVKAEKNGTLPYFLMDNRELMRSNDHVRKTILKGYDLGDASIDDLLSAYNRGALRNFDLSMYDQELTTVFNCAGISITERSIDIGKNEVCVAMRGSSTYGDFTLIRNFCIRGEQRIVVHDLFVLPEELQGQGVAKKMLAISYKHYLSAGIDQIELYANIRVGGYVWAKFGFVARAEDVNAIVANALRKKKIIDTEAKEIYVKIKTLTESGVVPMNALAHESYSKRLFYGSGWNGFIDLNNELQRLLFEANVFNPK